MTPPSIASQIEAAERAVLTLDMTIRVRRELGDLTTPELETQLEGLRQGVKTLQWVRDNADLLREMYRLKKEQK